MLHLMTPNPDKGEAQAHVRLSSAQYRLVTHVRGNPQLQRLRNP